jgi:ankyrin repeat protein
MHSAALWLVAVQVQLLVETGGANPLLTDRWGSTPLKEAQRVGAAPVAAYLQQAAARSRASGS